MCKYNKKDFSEIAELMQRRNHAVFELERTAPDVSMEFEIKKGKQRHTGLVAVLAVIIMIGATACTVYREPLSQFIFSFFPDRVGIEIDFSAVTSPKESLTPYLTTEIDGYVQDYDRQVYDSANDDMAMLFYCRSNALDDTALIVILTLYDTKGSVGITNSQYQKIDSDYADIRIFAAIEDGSTSIMGIHKNMTLQITAYDDLTADDLVSIAVCLCYQ